MQKMEQRYWWEHEEKTRVNRLNEKRSLILWGLERPFEKLIFLLDFCGFPNCLDVGKGRKLPYAAYNDLGNSSVWQLVWMLPCHFFLRREGVL